MPNKIKYGLSKVYYAVATLGDNNTATYGEPVALPGAVSLSLEPQGENTPFYADNIQYYIVNANNGYEGDLEIARIPDSFKTDVLGMVESGNGLFVEDAAAEVIHFALLFQFEGDVKATRHVMYNCTATRSQATGQTKTENIEPQTETITISAKPIHSATLNKDIVKADTNESTGSTVYDAWYTAVTMPTAATVTT